MSAPDLGPNLVALFERNGFSKPEAYAQFFWPMVVHRAIGAPAVSRVLEGVPRAIGLTGAFGSPILLRTVRL